MKVTAAPGSSVTLPPLAGFTGIVRAERIAGGQLSGWGLAADGVEWRGLCRIVQVERVAS